MIKQEILKAIEHAVGTKGVNLEFTENDEFGDYSSNVAMVTFEKTQKLKNSKTQKELAQEIAGKLKKDKGLFKVVDRIEVAGPGFINFWIKKDLLLSNLMQIIDQKENYGKSDFLKRKKFLIEHTSPNTIKTLHVGHVRNNILGLSVHNILEFAGADVTLDSINNDRGIHVMKAVWAYMKYGEDKTPDDTKEKPDHFTDKFYVMGAKKAEDAKIKEEMQELLRKWEAGDDQTRRVWKKLRDWTFTGFLVTYKRLGSYHDHQWFESDFYEHGKEMVLAGLKKGIFKKLPDGAVLSRLAKYNLPDTIVLRSDGTSMYHTQDLYLTKLKREKFNADFYIWDIGPEQILYLKQLFAMCEQLGIGSVSDYFHMSYGFVYLKGGGKMSSRDGNVISADWLIDEAVKKAKEVIGGSGTDRGLSEAEKSEVSEAVGIGAIKWGFLKMARETDVHFNMDESLALEGNSGPYLQYTVARTQSVLQKAMANDKWPVTNSAFDIQHLALNSEEFAIIRSLVRFSEVIVDAAKNYSPNILCSYLFDLAQKYNNFYNRHRIIDSDNLRLRLKLTSATGQVLKNGLKLLGVQTPERM